ncbi:MAG: PilZ domain-containing protein [Proteobacteria bacterium]|nr:PilZ domain-containing protein [Pseudomonadota bacterium]
MQLAERRDDPKRIDVARPLEIVGADGAAIDGYTRNLSATGLRARFDGHCSVGANLLVRIALEEGAPPVEQRARVVWSAPDVYGEGMDVGLRLLAGAGEAAIEDAPRNERAPLLAAGARVEVEYGGIALPAIVARVGEMSDSGVVQVTLRMVEDIVPFADGDEVVVEKAPIVERTLRYAAEARRLWLLHGLPVARLAAAAVRTFARRIAAAVSHRLRVSRQAP